MKFPNDDDGDVLRQMDKMGFDFSKDIDVEFTASVPSEKSMISIERVLTNAGYEAEGYFDEGELEEGEEITEENEEFGPSWTVYISKYMKLDYNKLVNIQNELDRLSAPFGGKSDGWVVQVP